MKQVGVLPSVKISGANLKLLRQNFKVELETTGTSSIEILWISLNDKIDKEFLKGFPNVKKIVMAATGDTNIATDIDQSISIVNLRNHGLFMKENITASTEHAWYMLMKANYLAGISNQETLFESIGNKIDRNQLKNKKLGIIGFGRIGENISKIAISFGMDIVFCDLMKERISYGEKLNLNYQPIDLFPSNLNFVLLCASYNRKNPSEIIDVRFINKQKLSPIYVNISRGSLIDEFSMLNALETKKASFYITDVLAKDDYPWSDQKSKLSIDLLSHNKFRFMNHIGGRSSEARDLCDNHLVNYLINNGCECILK